MRHPDVALEDMLPFKRIFVEKAYLNYDYATAFDCSQKYKCSFYFRLSMTFPHYYDHLPFVISGAFESADDMLLFSIAQRLILDNPRSEISLFAIGCFYLLKKKFDEAKRSFLKGINVGTKSFPYLWIGAGHVYSIFGEHELAISCYKNASGLLPKSVFMLILRSIYPLMFLAKEFVINEKLNIAEKYFLSAQSEEKDHPEILISLSAFYAHQNR